MVLLPSCPPGAAHYRLTWSDHGSCRNVSFAPILMGADLAVTPKRCPSSDKAAFLGRPSRCHASYRAAPHELAGNPIPFCAQAEVAALDADVAEAAATHAGACGHVSALLTRLTQRLRYEDVEVECDRRQAQARSSPRDLPP